MASFTTESFVFIDFTEMDEETSRQVFECRNLPEIREFMDNSNPLVWENHVDFINKLAQNCKKAYFAIYAKSTNKFIGSVNLHFEGSDSATRGIYLHPDCQGKGLSKKISREFYKYCRDIMGLHYINTKVFRNNEASNALQCTLGASRIGEDNAYFYYILDLGKFSLDKNEE